MKPSSFILIFLIVVFFSVAIVHGGYIVEPYTPRDGPSDTSGADSTISFFELPLWIQLAWIAGALCAIFGILKFGPFILGKVRIALQNKNRAAILQYIGSNPGCTESDLVRNTTMNRGTIRYHLTILLIEQKVIRRKNGKLSYLFTNGGIALEKKQVYGHIMNPYKRKILDILHETPGISNKDIAERADMSPSTALFHIQPLLDENMVVSQWDGRCRNYFIVPEVEDILKKYPR